MTDLNEQIERAFDYRGNVTLTCKDGETIEGFLFNRDFKPHAKIADAPFVELYLEDGSRKVLPIEQVSSVVLSGEDCAAT